MRKIMMVAGAAALALAGCGGHVVDREAWAKDLESLGVTVSDWDKLESVTRDLCSDSNDALRMFLAVAKDDGSSLKSFETNIRNVCPDRLDDFEDAVAEMGRTSGEVDAACKAPKSERTQRQALLAEAMGC
jgi:hypothetical protein